LNLAGQFRIAPTRFRERVEAIWGSVVKDSEALAAALAIVRELNDEVKALVEREGLRFGT
jgi:hypothetical protein